MTRSASSRSLLVCGAAFVFIACGGGDPPPPAAAPPAAKPPAGKAAGHGRPGNEVGEEARVGPIENPRWDMIAEHFVGFSRRPISARKDVFRSHLDKYVPKIDLVAVRAVDPEQAAEALDQKAQEDLHPLKKFPADEYKVVLIMTGTGSPKALVQDPKGGVYPVFVNSEVGNERGVVEMITQYEIVVRNPEDVKPVRLSARPEVFDVSKAQEDERAKQPE